jgi:hypothetical protein
MLDWSKSIGVAAALAVLILAKILSGPATCADGWGSPSIGTRGACSYHGGVAGGGTLWFVVSIVVGFTAWGFADARSPTRRRRQEEEMQKQLAEAEKVTTRRREFEEQQAAQSDNRSSPVTTGESKTVVPDASKRCLKCNEAMRAVISSVGPYANQLRWECLNSACDGSLPVEDNTFPAHFLPPYMKPRRKGRPAFRKRR